MTTDPVTVAAAPAAETFGVRVPGVARGPLFGGNLCLVTASLGTPDLPDPTGAILLIEEVEEPPYKIDRMLTQLRRAGVLGRVDERDADAEEPVAGAQLVLDALGGADAVLLDALGRNLGGYGVSILSNIDGQAVDDALDPLDPEG